MNDDDVEHEGRRNAVMIAAVLILGIGMVAAMFWVVRSMAAPAVSLSAVSTPTPTLTAVQATVPPVATTTFVPPTPTWVDATTLTLPPAALPTLIDPVPGQTADPDPDAPAPATSRATPPPQQTTPPPPTAPASATVSNINLTCSKAGPKIAAELSFTTTGTVTAAISAGGSVQRKRVDAGHVTIAASGRGPAFCAAVVAGQSVGPIPAT